MEDPKLILYSIMVSVFLNRIQTAWIALVLMLGCCASVEGQILDTLVFGDGVSEAAHQLKSPMSSIEKGALGQSARRMFPAEGSESGEGGYLEFTAKCDPLQDNYVTIKLWGSDSSLTASGIVYLYQIERNGQVNQVGYRDQQVGEYSPLAWGNVGAAPVPGRFYYTTIPLPLSITQGRAEVRLRIGASGLNSNGSLPVYRAYVHQGSYFVPSTADPQATPPAPAPLRPGAPKSMEEALDTAKKASNERISDWIAKGEGNADDLLTSYSTPWSSGYKNEKALSIAADFYTARIDESCRKYFSDPGSAGAGWGGSYGKQGLMISQMGEAGFGRRLDERVDLGDPSGPAPRRQLWAKMLKASRDSGRFGRQGPTSAQSVIGDYEIYRANKGLQTLNSPEAMPETQAIRYLLESSGFLPWLASDKREGGSDSFMGTNYYEVTPAGLTKENGYVSAYGEVYDLIAGFFSISGDKRIADQVNKIIRARSYFRYPMVDADGYRCFEMIGPLDWRHQQEFPVDKAYGERGSRLQVAPITGDPFAIGFAKQMFDENQGNTAYDTDIQTALLLEKMIGWQDSGHRLPMTEGQPDFAWTDVDNGLIVIKRGEDLTWIELYWQARGGIHSTGRAMQITPTSAHVSHIRIDTQFPWTQSWRSAADQVSWDGFRNRTAEGEVHQAYANEKIGQAANAPTGAQKDREEFIGRASFYSARYGRYLVGLNMDRANSYVLKTPPGFTSAQDLITKQPKSGKIIVAPFSAVVLDMGTDTEATPLPDTSRFITTTGVSNGVAVYWDGAGGAARYNLKRSTTAGGPYTTIATNLGGIFPRQWGQWPFGTFLDTNTFSGTTYYYKVSGSNVWGEGYDSPESLGGSPGKETKSVNKLPEPWFNANFSGKGSAAYDDGSGSFKLKGGGGDFWGNEDGGHFVYQSLFGDGDLVARMVDRGDALKTGLMFRDSLAANGREVSLLSESGGMQLFTRNATGGGTTYSNGVEAPTLPFWLKIERRGRNLSFFHATDVEGKPGDWILQGAASPEQGILVYLGIAASSGSPIFDHVSFSNVTSTDPALPSPPDGLSATARNGSVVLEWLPASGASTYTVKRATTEKGPYANVAAGITLRSFTDKGLANGTSYYYSVSASNAKGEGENSVQFKAIPCATASVPENFKVNCTGTQAALTWNPAEGATGYDVLRSIDGFTWETVGKNCRDATYVDTGLASGQIYSYAVASVNGNGVSAATAPAMAVPVSIAPQLTDARGIETRAFLTWTTSPSATEYQVKRSETAGGPYMKVSSGLTSASFIDAGLTRNKSYYYVITAVNAAGESAPSPEMKLGWGSGLLGSYFNNNSFGGSPVLIRVDSSILFNWGQGSPARGIFFDNFTVRWTGELEAPLTGSFTFATGQADDSMTISINGIKIEKEQSDQTDLVAGKRYPITIEFREDSGAAFFSPIFWSAAGLPRQVLPTSRLYPDTVLVNRAVGGTASASAASSQEQASNAFDGKTETKWFADSKASQHALRYKFAPGAEWAVTEYRLTSAEDIPERDPKTWRLEGSNDGGNWTPLDTQSEQKFSDRRQTLVYPIANPAPYSSYRLLVMATAGDLPPQIAELELLSPGTLPLAPEKITAAVQGNQAVLNWSAVTGAKGYLVRRSIRDGGPYTPIATVESGTNYVDQKLAPGETYYYVIGTISDKAEGENSSQVSVLIPSGSSP